MEEAYSFRTNAHGVVTQKNNTDKVKVDEVTDQMFTKKGDLILISNL
jgi:hypothetical protein